MIHLSDVTKTYDNGFTALEKVDLDISSGEIFGIIGKSGAGKSTLLRCLNLLEYPSSGEIIINKESLCFLSSAELRQARFQQAMIFQHFNLMSNKTVFENIALPMKIQGKLNDNINSRIEELLDLVELSDKADAYPSQLSGGQKQRVAIARALSCEPKLLLCDEATSALDPQTTHSILQLLKTINQRFAITIVLITHEMDVIKQICHRLAVIDQGKIVEAVPVKQLFQQADTSLAKQLFIKQLTPILPDYLNDKLQDSGGDSHYPIAKILFYHNSAQQPFISQLSRELMIDINILQANIDAIDEVTFGVLILELRGKNNSIEQFYQRCKDHELTVEVLGYVNAHVL